MTMVDPSEYFDTVSITISFPPDKFRGHAEWSERAKMAAQVVEALMDGYGRSGSVVETFYGVDEEGIPAFPAQGIEVTPTAPCVQCQGKGALEGIGKSEMCPYCKGMGRYEIAGG